MFGRGQTVVIKGKANVAHYGKSIHLLQYHDYFSGLKYIEDSDTIGNDGYFELHTQTKLTKPVFLKIGNLSGKLYIKPDYVYGVTFPGIPDAMDYRSEGEVSVDIGIIGADSTELNAQVIDFSDQYNTVFMSKKAEFLSRAKIIKRIDSLTLICQKRYKNSKDPYFKSLLPTVWQH